MKLDHINPADPVELGYRPGHLIWRVQQRGWRLFMEEVGKPDITPVQATVLMVIGNQPGIDQKRLAATIALDKATTGNVVARLVKRELVTRVVPEADRRARALFLTKRGKGLNLKLGVVTRNARNRLLEGLSDEDRKTLIRLLRVLACIDG